MKSTRDKLKVLIIDSPSQSIKNIYDIFNEEGLTVFYTENSDEGYNKCYEISPHLIILEALSEPMNGFEIVRRLKKEVFFKNCSIIMCSDREDSFDKVWAKEQGVDIYLIKPINKNIIIKAAKKILKSKMRK